MPPPQAYLSLGIAIVAETVATSALAASQSFTRLVPSLVSISGYGIAIFLLSLTVRTMPVGVAYAIWSGLGIVFVSAFAWLWYKQSLDAAAIIGILLIISGCIVINLFSSSPDRHGAGGL